MSTATATPFKKLDKPIEDCMLVCRGCLVDTGEMKNIFEWGLADDYYRLTNVQVLRYEGISELLCLECEDAVERFRMFQKTCLSSDTHLRTVKHTSEEQIVDNTEKVLENSITAHLNENTLNFFIQAPISKEKIYLPCQYCKEKFLKKHDLENHAFKFHDSNLTVNLQYNCPYKNCGYNKNKFFTGRKYLNQHLNKVHQTKIVCDKCTVNFSNVNQFDKHLKTCSELYKCEFCENVYKTNDRLLVHLSRKHPNEHQRYIKGKRKMEMSVESKRLKNNLDSPKRSLATQTQYESIKNDVPLVSWNKSDLLESKTDDISTQTVFEDLLSLKSQNSEDESLFFSETVSLSDIQTQTFDFGLTRLDKETITSEFVPVSSIKETQTCYCLYDGNLRDGSELGCGFISIQTQTLDAKSTVKSDVMLSFSSAETQTSFDDTL